MTDKEIQIDTKAFLEGYDQGYEDGKHDEAKRSYTKKQLREMGFAFTTNGDIVTPSDMGNMAERYFEYRKKKWLEKAKQWLGEQLYMYTESHYSKKQGKMVDIQDWVTSDHETIKDFIDEFAKAMEE